MNDAGKAPAIALQATELGKFLHSPGYPVMLENTPLPNYAVLPFRNNLTGLTAPKNDSITA
jgi:hypothetical protein